MNEEDGRGHSTSFDSVKRTAPRPTPIWLVMQTRRTQGRQNRAESRYHYLSPCGAGKKGKASEANTYPPPANKDPHAEICIADVLRAGGSGEGREARLMKIGFEPRNSRAPSRGKVRKDPLCEMLLGLARITRVREGHQPGSDDAAL